jgi:hypothetical protein
MTKIFPISNRNNQKADYGVINNKLRQNIYNELLQQAYDEQ